MKSLGLWWGTVEGAGIPELAGAARAAGFDQISVSPPLYFAARASGATDAELRRVLSDNGLSVAMLDPLIRGLPGSPLPEQVARRFRATFEHGEVACFRAAARGLEVWIEFMPDGGIPDLATAYEILRTVGSPNLGLTIDTWHLFRTGIEVEELRRLPPGSIRALQVADAHADLRGTGTKPPSADRLLPGAGATPLREIVAIALENHADVAIGVEVFDRARLAQPPLERAQAAARALRSVL